jgi:hypothetical protein
MHRRCVHTVRTIPSSLRQILIKNTLVFDISVAIENYFLRSFPVPLLSQRWLNCVSRSFNASALLVCAELEHLNSAALLSVSIPYPTRLTTNSAPSFLNMIFHSKLEFLSLADPISVSKEKISYSQLSHVLFNCILRFARSISTSIKFPSFS